LRVIASEVQCVAWCQAAKRAALQQLGVQLRRCLRQPSVHAQRHFSGFVSFGHLFVLTVHSRKIVKGRELLPTVMNEVPPLPGEEALYASIYYVLEAARDNPALQQALKDVAVATEKDAISGMFEFRNNGVPAGNGWRTQRTTRRASASTTSSARPRPRETCFPTCPTKPSTSVPTSTARASA
jgi:hypothetical protein